MCKSCAGRRKESGQKTKNWKQFSLCENHLNFTRLGIVAVSGQFRCHQPEEHLGVWTIWICQFLPKKLRVMFPVPNSRETNLAETNEWNHCDNRKTSVIRQIILFFAIHRIEFRATDHSAPDLQTGSKHLPKCSTNSKFEFQTNPNSSPEMLMNELWFAVILVCCHLEWSANRCAWTQPKSIRRETS